MYGNGTDDQLIFLAPSTQQTPVFVDRIDGMCITCTLSYLIDVPQKVCFRSL